MKFIVVLAIFGFVAVKGEAPAAPYAPRGWRPSGPAFELPTEVNNQPNQEYGSPEIKSEVEVTEEELQYTGELATTEATTPFLEYGLPATDAPEDFGTTVSSSDYDDLSVQGLPGTESAAEFRTGGFERFTSRRNQKFQAQPAKLRQAPIRNQFRLQFGARLTAAPNQNRNRFNQNQFSRLTAPAPIRKQNSRLRALPVFNQRFPQFQRQTLDSYGAPAQNYGPPTQEYAPPPTQEYGTPAQEYGPPAPEYGPPEPSEAPQEEFPREEPEEEPVEAPEFENEENSETEEESDEEANVAISNAVATAKYVKGRSGRLIQAPRANFRNGKSARLQQTNQPIYMYNQFGQLVRIY